MMLSRLAWRSIWRHRRRTLITVLSIGLGLAAVVFYVALAEGMYRQLVEDAVRLYAGHVTVEAAGYRDTPVIELRVRAADTLRRRLATLPDVVGTKLMVLGHGMASSSKGAAGIAVMGVEPHSEVRTSPLAKQIVAGAYLDAADDARIVVGVDLADRLGLAVGRKLVITTNDATGALVETLLRVQGIFRTGSDELDGYVVQLPITAARRLFHLEPDEATQVGVLLAHPDAEPDTRAAIGTVVADDGLAVRSWTEIIPELAAFIQLDKTSDGTFQGLLLFLVLFTIVNTLLMSVLERQHELAVRRALGTTSGHIAGQILLESAFIGVLGVALGLAVGSAVSLWVQVYGWDLRGLYSTELTVSGLVVSPIVHAHLAPWILLKFGTLVFVGTVLAGLGPMRRAVTVPLVETLRT